MEYRSKTEKIFGFAGNYGSVGYGKQCSLQWSCVEERGWSRLEKGIEF